MGQSANWIETRLTKPASALVIVAEVARNADGLSGGRVNPQTWPSAVFGAYALATTLALAVGLVIMMGSSGRAARRKAAEAGAVAGVPGLSKVERAARTMALGREARLYWIACLVSGILSLYGAAYYVFGGSVLTGGVASAITATACVAITAFFAVIYDEPEEDPRETARRRGRAIQELLVNKSAERLLTGEGERQDVKMIYAQLPVEDRSAFLSAHTQENDPLWTVADIAAWRAGWLGLEVTRGTPEWNAQTRAVQRTLKQAQRDGEMIGQDDRGRNVVARSVVYRLYAEEYASVSAVPTRDKHATNTRQTRDSGTASSAEYSRRTRDNLATWPRQTRDTSHAETA